MPICRKLLKHAVPRALSFGRPNVGNSSRRQDRDDADDHEQFDQRESQFRLSSLDLRLSTSCSSPSKRPP
jgi:hypothetical protein